MLDAQLKRIITPLLDQAGRALVRRSVTANQITALGLLLGGLAAMAIAVEAYLAGLVILLISRLADGLDGAVARASRVTDFGGYLDIVFDFIFYGLIPASFALARPDTNAVPAVILLLAFYANGASFLAFAIMAEKRALATESHGVKSLYFTTGLAEAAETYAFFVTICLLPDYFPLLAYAFAALTALTTIARLILAAKLFREEDGEGEEEKRR
jgi:phosphatidylglycerophosphate synthase